MFIRRVSNSLYLSFQQAAWYTHYSFPYSDSDYFYEFLILVKIIRSQSTITFEWANTKSNTSTSLTAVQDEEEFRSPCRTTSAKLVEEAGSPSSRRIETVAGGAKRLDSMPSAGSRRRYKQDVIILTLREGLKDEGPVDICQQTSDIISCLILNGKLTLHQRPIGIRLKNEWNLKMFDRRKVLF